MKDEAIEICSFNKMTLKSEKLFFFVFSFFQAVKLVCVELRSRAGPAGRSVGRSKLLGTLQISEKGFI